MTGKRRGWDIASRRSAGFTLIELLIVITLIVVLAGIGLATYSTSVRRAKEAVLRENLFRMRDALDQHNADKGNWPPDLATLVSAGYIRAIPKDPITDSADTWVPVTSEIDPAKPDEPPGIENVKSGAPGAGMDGSNYADW